MSDPILFTYENISLDQDVLTSRSAQLSRYASFLEKRLSKDGVYEEPEDSIRLPSDKNLAGLSLETAARLWSKQLKYIFLIGIGGSNLGTEAVLHALRKALVVPEEGFPTIFFADTVDARQTDSFIALLETRVHHADEVLYIVISKSGTTTESIVNAEILLAPFVKKFPHWKSRVICVTDQGSLLSKHAEKLGLATLPIPKSVGGRYSVFSSVGIFPLALLGVDVAEFQKGGADAAVQCVLPALEKNPAMRGAIVLTEAIMRGCNIHNMFFFDPSFESLGKWYRQLLAESIGKERDRDGNMMRTGMTPIVSLGSTDLHSMAQLYFGGPRDKFTTLVMSTSGSHSQHAIPKDSIFSGLVAGIQGRKPEEVMHAIASGTEAAYRSLKLPFARVDIGRSGAYELGAFLQWKMIETMYLAELLNVNAFDQPGVEEYKRETRRLLEYNIHQ